MNNDIYAKINDIVLEGLKKDGLKWFKPWKSDGRSSTIAGFIGDMPMNWLSRKRYNGINIWILSYEMKRHNYDHNEWMTFKQCSSNGGKIIKGSKSTDIYFWKVGAWDNKEQKFVADTRNINWNEQHDGQDRYRKTFSLRFYKVFNVAQTTLEPRGKVEEIEPEEVKPEEVTETPDTEEIPERIELAKKVMNCYLDRSKVKLVHYEQQAYYRPFVDTINMPEIDTFVDQDSYYKTLFHEMAHSTGHESRLNRAGITKSDGFGKVSYSKEELVAEITAMYVSGITNLEPKDNHENSQAYLKGWISYLSDKDKEIVNAMTQAAKASDLILNIG